MTRLRPFTQALVRLFLSCRPSNRFRKQRELYQAEQARKQREILHEKSGGGSMDFSDERLYIYMGDVNEPDYT